MLLKSFDFAQLAVGVFFLISVLFLSQIVSAQSTISGTIFDPQRNPLPDVDIELLDDFNRQINRARTDDSGRYQFNGLGDGRYTIKVLPFRYDYLDQSQLVEISTINLRGGQGNSYETRDFYLQAKKGSLADSETGVVFAQSIPKEAEKAYEHAIKDLSKQRTEDAIAGLRSAIKVFPDYFLALQQLGRILVVKGEFGEAAPLLLKAVEINPKSPTTLFYLGYSLYQLNYNKAAVTALNQAYTLAPASIQVLLALGKAERSEGKYDDAEKHLLRAKKLSKIGIADLHWELAQLYGRDLGRYKEAADELEQYLKAGRFDNEQTQKVKKLIADFREKAKVKAG